MTKSDDVQALSDWIIETALRTSDYVPLFGEFCERLVAIGIPVSRVHLSMTTIHPLTEAITIQWFRATGEADIQSLPHGSNMGDRWQQSPLKTLADSGHSEIRFDLSHNRNWPQYPVLQELSDEGATDYIAFLSIFSELEHAIKHRDGMLTSWTTDEPGGFTDEHVSILRRLIPRFAIVAKLANRERLREHIAFAYLGENAGKQVLDGKIKLGDGQNIRAVIWFSDLRSSTALAEQLPSQEFLNLLNDYFDSVAGAAIEHGGEVLRFIGDAALAIFPIDENGYSEQEARERALKSATAASMRAEVHNKARTEAGLPPFRYGIGLHVGDIMFGNIGVPSRVEFSVIGPAANAAARLESLTKTLDRRVLVSREFADGLDHNWEHLGEHDLRGSDHTMEVLSPTRMAPTGM
ncbi:MAG: adenylate/guanylate cyclase domain-containing protein [Rhodospirillales bacterium]|jgi:adenylate cyclase|nr:adenylate/guanylate cyclase domain-containing protein [Rhodospirillales bacterium]MBT4039928.1 adenylate/guanylate cyclase domain-containing protein [Rhodospirillales bacterium]MBT4625167.1 adenylate/guanylate cyclase domain-containing protein [Rhodospirillales bacterium]MBT5351317.1 adenylate/guanylate cyclase domain-containing protein [Rhodospirillales bacterium]MBT5521953.1 adenylate/guanylate cyclase domain-containing protein [Rhodospirillales bacterium]